SFDFSLSNTGNKSVNAGSSIGNTITASLVSGKSQQDFFSMAGLPSGAAGSFSQVSCNPTCSSKLSVSTTAATPAGNFPIAVTAKGGGITKSTSFTLTVSPPTPPFDFSLFNFGGVSVLAGSSVTSSIVATLASGTSQKVGFSIAGL